MKSLDYLNLTNLIKTQFSCPIYISDSDYLVTTTKWITKIYAPYFKNVLNTIEFRYITNAQDCENFAELARVFAQIANARTQGEAGVAGLAFGVIWIPGHAINIAAVSDSKNNISLKFFEPQISLDDYSIVGKCFKEVILTNEQIAKSQFILI
jgi:hypothetical protein